MALVTLKVKHFKNILTRFLLLPISGFMQFIFIGWYFVVDKYLLIMQWFELHILSRSRFVEGKICVSLIDIKPWIVKRNSPLAFLSYLLLLALLVTCTWQDKRWHSVCLLLRISGLLGHWQQHHPLRQAPHLGGVRGPGRRAQHRDRGVHDLQRGVGGHLEHAHPAQGAGRRQHRLPLQGEGASTMTSS